MPRTKRKGRRLPTHMEIAEALGLSTAAISFALNDKPSVSERTKVRVQNYIEHYIKSSGTDMGDMGDLTKLTHKSTIFLSYHVNEDDDKKFILELIDKMNQESHKGNFEFMHKTFNKQVQMSDFEDIPLSEIKAIVIINSAFNEKDEEVYSSLITPTILINPSREMNGITPFSGIRTISSNQVSSIKKICNWAVKNEKKTIGFVRDRKSVVYKDFQRIVENASLREVGSFRAEIDNEVKEVARLPEIYISDSYEVSLKLAIRYKDLIDQKKLIIFNFRNSEINKLLNIRGCFPSLDDFYSSIFYAIEDSKTVQSHVFIKINGELKLK